MRPTSLVLAVFAASLVSLALCFLALPGPERRRLRAHFGGAALLLTALATAPALPVVAVPLAAAGFLQAGAPAGSLWMRMRRQLLGAVLLALGAVLLRSAASFWAPRAGAVAIVLGLLLVLGLAPFLERYEQPAPLVLSPLAWLGLLGPLAFVGVMQRMVASNLRPDVGAIFAALLVAFGFVNLVFGVFAAWRADSAEACWHYAFLADWGLALVGAGLLLPQAFAGAYLVLLALLLARVPLYAAAQPRREGQGGRLTPLGLIVAVALSGAAPFAGFPARLLLLQAATSVSLVVTMVLAAAMVLWLLHSVRLAHAAALPAGRRGVAATALAASVVLGLYPGPFLALAGLRPVG